MNHEGWEKIDRFIVVRAENGFVDKGGRKCNVLRSARLFTSKEEAESAMRDSSRTYCAPEEDRREWYVRPIQITYEVW